MSLNGSQVLHLCDFIYGVPFKGIILSYSYFIFPLEKHFKNYFLCKAFSDFSLIDIILSLIDVML